MADETERYRFDAPDGHTLIVGDEIYEPGAKVDLPAGQVDPRLTPIPARGKTDEPVAEVPDEPTVTADSPPPAEEPPASSTGFGHPKRAK